MNLYSAHCGARLAAAIPRLGVVGGEAVAIAGDEDTAAD